MSLRKESYKNLERYRQTKYQQTLRYYRKTQLYAPRRWTHEEDQLVLKHEYTDSVLSEMIGRSVGSIQTRRSYLKKTLNLEKEFLQ